MRQVTSPPPGAAGPGPEGGGVALDGGAPVIQEGRQFGYPQPSKARAIDLAVLAREFLTDSLTTGNTEQMLLIQNSFTEVFASYPKKGVLQCRS